MKIKKTYTEFIKESSEFIDEKTIKRLTFKRFKSKLSN